MYTHASEMFFDVYPFVNSIDGLPSARVSLYKPTAPRHNSWSVSVGRERFTGAALNDAIEQSVMWKESR